MSGLETTRWSQHTCWSSLTAGSPLKCVQPTTPEDLWADRWVPWLHRHRTNINKTPKTQKQNITKPFSLCRLQSCWDQLQINCGTLRNLKHDKLFDVSKCRILTPCDVTYSSDKSKQQMLVLYDFTSRNSKELTVKKGDIVEASIRNENHTGVFFRSSAIKHLLWFYWLTAAGQDQTVVEGEGQ